MYHSRCGPSIFLGIFRVPFLHDIINFSINRAAIFQFSLPNIKTVKTRLKDPSQARLCYCFDLKFAIKLLVERDKTSTVQLVKI